MTNEPKTPESEDKPVSKKDTSTKSMSQDQLKQIAGGLIGKYAGPEVA